MNMGRGENESAPWFSVRFNQILYSGHTELLSSYRPTYSPHAIFSSWLCSCCLHYLGCSCSFFTWLIQFKCHFHQETFPAHLPSLSILSQVLLSSVLLLNHIWLNFRICHVMIKYLYYVCLSNKKINFWRMGNMPYPFLTTFPPLITQSCTSQLLDKC